MGPCLIPVAFGTILAIAMLIAAVTVAVKYFVERAPTSSKEEDRTRRPDCDYTKFSRNTYNCGYHGITKTSCEARGCCSDKSSYPTCFCPNVDSYLTYGDFGRYKRAGHVKVSKTFGKCLCKGIELGKGGGGPRTLKVTCNTLGTSKGNCKGQSLTCEYKGNPHPCKQYPKKAVHVYTELLGAVGMNQCKILKDGGSQCPSGLPFNTRSTCTNVKFICQ